MEQFNYARLDLARKRRGMTKVALADAVGISTRSLTKYEKGDQTPTPLRIAQFARTLNFPAAFFSGDTLDEPPLDGSSFRALSTLTARQRDQALGSGALALHLSKWIGERFDLPEPEVPHYREIDPEAAAEAVRDFWGLGNRPIPNMIQLLEAHGVRVFSLAEECAEVDAFSFWHGSTPYVFLNTMKNTEHSRMDAAHELGHLVLHYRGYPQGRQAENEAHAFGSALLMPAATVLAEVPPGARLTQLIKLKRHWRVSTVNLARRAHKLGLLTDWQYRSICIALSKRGRTNEPNPIGTPEKSQVLAKVFRALKAENVSKGAIARELRIPVEELNKSVFGLLALTVHEGDQQGTPGERPTLKVV